MKKLRNTLTSAKATRYRFQLEFRPTQSFPVSSLYDWRRQVSPHILNRTTVYLTVLSSTVSYQVLIAAAGEIATTSYPGEYGGEYSESITGSNSITVVQVQVV